MSITLSKTEEQLTENLMNKISLKKDKDNLEKHVVNLSKTVISLSKKFDVDLGDTCAKVVVALDYSGSMERLYRNGTVQNTLNRLIPLGLNFDDDNLIEVFLFQNDFIYMDPISVNNYENYVNDVIYTSDYRMGGTHYFPVLNSIINGGIGKCLVKKTKKGILGKTKELVNIEDMLVGPIVSEEIPTFVLFITDGDTSDEGSTDSLMKKVSDKNVFIQFIGIGNSDFSYLRELDEMTERTRDNTGFSRMESLENVSDEELYSTVLEQFSEWLKGHQ